MNEWKKIISFIIIINFVVVWVFFFALTSQQLWLNRVFSFFLLNTGEHLLELGLCRAPVLVLFCLISHCLSCSASSCSSVLFLLISCCLCHSASSCYSVLFLLISRCLCRSVSSCSSVLFLLISCCLCRSAWLFFRSVSPPFPLIISVFFPLPSSPLFCHIWWMDVKSQEEKMLRWLRYRPVCHVIGLTWFLARHRLEARWKLLHVKKSCGAQRYSARN